MVHPQLYFLISRLWRMPPYSSDCFDFSSCPMQVSKSALAKENLGDILMLSEGKHGVDNVFSLRNGEHGGIWYRCNRAVVSNQAIWQAFWPWLLTRKRMSGLELSENPMVWRVIEVQSLDGVSSAYICKSSLLNDIVVEINLRLPSMLHGKKGFDRIVYAFKNVITDPVTWLFTDLRTQSIYSCWRQRLLSI